MDAFDGIGGAGSSGEDSDNNSIGDNSDDAAAADVQTAASGPSPAADASIGEAGYIGVSFVNKAEVAAAQTAEGLLQHADDDVYQGCPISVMQVRLQGTTVDKHTAIVQLNRTIDLIDRVSCHLQHYNAFHWLDILCVMLQDVLRFV